MNTIPAVVTPPARSAAELRDEIKRLVEDAELERGIKRLLDFARNLSVGRHLENQAVAISMQYNRARQNERMGERTAAEIEVDYTTVGRRVLELADLIWEQSEPGSAAPDELIRPVLRLVGENENTPASNAVTPTAEPPSQERPGEAADATTPFETAREEFRRRFRAEEGDTANLVFRCRGLKKSYDRDEFVLTDVDLNIRPGEIMGLVGVNGVGKTTLLRIIAGELRHTAGSLAYPMLDSGRFDWQNIRRQIGYVQQSPAQWYGRLGDNLHLHAAYHGFHDRENLEETAFILHRLGLAAYRDATWNEIAGGYKMRFELARVLITRPRLLVLDEPLAPLDVVSQQMFLQDLRDLASSARSPLAIIFSSQHLYEVESVADTILFLASGKPAFYGPPEKIGEYRIANVFELSCPVAHGELHRMLEGLKGLQIRKSGTKFVVSVARSVTANQVLQRILDSGVTLNYFRDISRSTRLLLDTHQAEIRS